MLTVVLTPKFDLTKHLTSVELAYINLALGVAQGNKAKASRLLGINRTTLIEKCRKHGLKLNAPCGKKAASC